MQNKHVTKYLGSFEIRNRQPAKNVSIKATAALTATWLRHWGVGANFFYNFINFGTSANPGLSTGSLSMEKKSNLNKFWDKMCLAAARFQCPYSIGDDVKITGEGAPNNFLDQGTPKT